MSDQSLGPFNPTPSVVLEKAAELLALSAIDVVFEPGCGDAGFLKRCAGTVAKACGIELDESLYRRAVAATDGLDNVTIELGDACDASLWPDDATAMYVYLIPKGLPKISELIRAFLSARPENRLVAYTFSLPGEAVPQGIVKTTVRVTIRDGVLPMNLHLYGRAGG